jgi:phosphoglycolate phosphatase
MRRLVLCDIDGTLISTGGRAGEAIVRAMSEVLDRTVVLDGYSFAGKTDPQIVLELAARAGVTETEARARCREVLDRYLTQLQAILGPGTVRVLPGVAELLGQLSRRSDVALGLLTGNIREGARLKLGRAGLSGFFEVGAYGSDNEDRNALVEVARARAAERWGDSFPANRTVVLGDAEADVRCARAGGARAVAVASGTTSLQTLAQLHPDALLESLQSPRALPALLEDLGQAT